MLEPDWGESHWPAGGFLFQDVFFCSVDWSQGCRSAAINWQRLNWNSDGSRMNCSGRGSSRRSRCVSFPVLRGIDAQLLVGTGITTATDLVRADIAMLQQLMSEYAATREGKRIVRSSRRADCDTVRGCFAEPASSSISALQSGLAENSLIR